MKKFGLIGKTLKHSFSKTIHALLADYQYDLVELNEDELESWIKKGEYCGFNVTIPYKKEIIKYLDEIDELALEIGAVNTVVRKNGKLLGYNTDFFGMDYALKRAGISLKDKKVMILGSGGTSNTAKVLAKRNGAKKIVIVSRLGEVNYENYMQHNDAQVIINTTPVGMYPNTENSLVDINGFSQLSGVLDVIYNPILTKLLFDCELKGIKYSNGMPMLIAQASKAKDLFIGQNQADESIEKIIQSITKQKQNILLIGMAGCGKSSVGKKLALKLNRKFIDTDEIIVQKEKRDINLIFSQSGEEYFRKVESEVLEEVGKQTGQIIATGGGIVEKQQNHFFVKQNGVVFWLTRDLEMLDRTNRPLSKDLNAVKQLYSKRKEKYKNLADFVIDNNGTIEKTVKEILDNYENFSN